MNTAMTIAGSDSSGGAGIQADIKTMTMNGVYAMSAITALTAQNTTGVFDVLEVTSEFLHSQIKANVTDIFPDAVKTGMVSSSALIECISDCVKEFKLKNLIVDPVMVATSGAKLISEQAVETLKTKLLPLADLITPNIPEAECLVANRIKILTSDDMEKAAKMIYEEFGCNVLVKGGHQINEASDYLFGYDSQGNSLSTWYKGRRIENSNTHGTGCTLSSAITANVAKGQNLNDAVKNAKEYISGALEAMLNLGQGSGPLMHNYKLFN